MRRLYRDLHVGRSRSKCRSRQPRPDAGLRPRLAGRTPAAQSQPAASRRQPSPASPTAIRSTGWPEGTLPGQSLPLSRHGPGLLFPSRRSLRLRGVACDTQRADRALRAALRSLLAASTAGRIASATPPSGNFRSASGTMTGHGGRSRSGPCSIRDQAQCRQPRTQDSI